MYHSTLGLRVIQKKKKGPTDFPAGDLLNLAGQALRSRVDLHTRHRWSNTGENTGSILVKYRSFVSNDEWQRSHELPGLRQLP